MIRFTSDYAEGAEEHILQAMMGCNREQIEGYGEDGYCAQAKARLKEKMQCDDCEIYFLVGGTQVNLTVMAHFLRPYQAVIAVETGHICVHETGAIEATGHKVIAMPGCDGKLTPARIREALATHTDHHMVQPKLVYLSNPTEMGTLYSKAELQAIAAVCQEQNLFLYIDGARLASALTAVGNDLALSDYPHYADAFYIGGTKCGALFGEALVLTERALRKDFAFSVKQKGALLAKGWLLGLQFLTLFQDDLYLHLGEHANQMALRLKEGIRQAGYDFLVDSLTNQQFPIFPLSVITALEKKYGFSLWSEAEQGRMVVRLVTSWATKEDDVVQFIKDLTKISREDGWDGND